MLRVINIDAFQKSQRIKKGTYLKVTTPPQ